MERPKQPGAWLAAALRVGVDEALQGLVGQREVRRAADFAAGSQARAVFGRSGLVVAGAAVVTAAEKVLSEGEAAHCEALPLWRRERAVFRCLIPVLDQRQQRFRAQLRCAFVPVWVEAEQLLSNGTRRQALPLLPGCHQRPALPAK